MHALALKNIICNMLNALDHISLGEIKMAVAYLLINAKSARWLSDTGFEIFKHTCRILNL